MSLSNFFRINMPYGAKRNEKNEWFVFNREYLPLGWNEKKEFVESDLPIFQEFYSFTTKEIKKILDDKCQVGFDDDGHIKEFFIYNDGNNPSDNPEYWDRYISIIKKLSALKRKK